MNSTVAEEKLRQNKYDLEAWTVLIKDHQSRRMDEQVREFYERLVETFPLTGRFWKVYIEHEIKAKNYERVEKLFARCLQKVLNIDLWKCYLHYIKETKGSQPSFREKMSKAYEFALDNIGMDYQSYSIWIDYVNFLRNVEAIGSYAENQKITATRKIYQRGIINPMINIENFWKEYVEYEKNINVHIADKMTSERSKDYMKSRGVAKELEVIIRGLNKNLPSIPPSIATADDERQVDIWRRLINWEKSNPMKFEDENDIIKRVVFTYEQALLCLGHYPDIWYEYALYMETLSRSVAEKGADPKKYQDDAAAIYEKSISSLLKDNILLHFAYADFEESRNRKIKSAEIYDKILAEDNIDPTLIYVQYMRFARRSEGIKIARNIFKRAREDSRTKYHAYVAAALMEYHCQRDVNVACKIFELALKKFPANCHFILAYINFLTSLNEANNTRVLFEKVLTSPAILTCTGNEKSDNTILDIWNKFLEFESNIGDLASISKVELRRSLVYDKIMKQMMEITKDEKSPLPKITETALLVDRYKFLDLFPCTNDELRAINYDVASSLSSTSSSSLLSSLQSKDQSNSNLINKKRADPTGDLFSSDSKSRSACLPDTKQMIPFKPAPSYYIPPGSHSVPGGVFPPPPAVAAILQQLPHPSSFKGPFVSIDGLINLLVKGQVRNPRPEGISGPNGHRLFETAAKARNNSPSDSNSGAKKRPFDLDDEDEGSNHGIQSNNDIYRNRKIKNSIGQNKTNRV